jgi:hypothetical protein
MLCILQCICHTTNAPHMVDYEAVVIAVNIAFIRSHIFFFCFTIGIGAQE